MSRRSLLPREHGAYVQLGIPVIAAWATHGLAAASGLIGVAACLTFLAYEPLAILVGARGERSREQLGRRALRRLLGLGGAALAAGGAGLALAPATALVFAAGSGACGLALFGFVARRREHSLLGEIIAAIAMTGASAVVLAAGGASAAHATRWWFGWALAFSLSIVAVQRVIARHRTRASTIDRALAFVFASISICLGADPVLPMTTPLALLSTAIVMYPPSATRLRTIGIVTATTAAVSAVLAVLS